VNCTTNQKDSTGKIVSFKQSFLGYMLYNRWWFHHDRYGLTIGGGKINKPWALSGVAAPINGATATSGTPYSLRIPAIRTRPGTSQEPTTTCPASTLPSAGSTTTDTPMCRIFSGPGGVTPPGGNNGNPGALIANWQPDLRTLRTGPTMAILVKF